MLSQRWTLVVVCAATAMLMRDIAVVNTALSDIAADLDTGLSGLQRLARRRGARARCGGRRRARSDLHARHAATEAAPTLTAPA
jgi:hypothetical protein